MVPSVPSCPVRVALLFILIAVTAGCETYTVEYRKRPEYYANWGGEVPDRVVREDGTVVLYNADPDEGDPCLLYTSPSPRDTLLSRMPSSA